MASYLVRRLLLGLAILVAVTILAFALVRLGGDVAVMLAGENATAADVEAVRAALQLDQPLHRQYLRWAGDALRGDFGDSLVFPVPAMQMILERLPVTVSLAFAALGVALAVAIPLAVAAALDPGSALDRGVLLAASLGQAAPTFFVGLLLILIFGVELQWLPIAGNRTHAHFVLPVAVLAFHAMPAFLRLTRASLVDVMASDHVRTARAKGLAPVQVILRHALPIAILPVLSLAAVQLGGLLEGAIVVEAVFALDGIGMLVWQSVQRLDFMVIQAIVFWSALVYIVLTLLADLANAALNPRLRVAA